MNAELRVLGIKVAGSNHGATHNPSLHLKSNSNDTKLLNSVKTKLITETENGP